MNTYYYVEGNLYINQEDAEDFVRRHCGRITAFETNLDFAEVQELFAERDEKMDMSVMDLIRSIEV